MNTSQNETTISDRSVLRLSNRMDLLSTTAAQVRKHFFELLDLAQDPYPAVVELDLRGARMVDSVGLNLIVSVVKRVREWNGVIRVLVDSQNVRRCLQFTRLDTVAEVVLDKGLNAGAETGR